ncbi:hypothetical protein Q361_10689 [Flavobacterium croceum DSM 17960]|uniref:Uncharacterized protein n=1 Tax=Flavobacterium croceum DSM 17960 TaxID=1121886 RepID=A0A2S4N8L0_9FLAO|nr:hypothetical protein Q361_10689 [Flavobacterium croceum DSM 17960]
MKLKTMNRQQGIVKNGDEVLNRTFEHFMYLCAIKTQTSAIPKTVKCLV